MVKIEAESLEGAYSLAADKLTCSITQLNIEVIQAPSSGFLGLFKKKAIIVATSKVLVQEQVTVKPEVVRAATPVIKQEVKKESEPLKKTKETEVSKKEVPKREVPKKKLKPKVNTRPSRNDIILPASFVTDQEDDYDGSDLYDDEDEEIYVGAETEICDKSHDEIHEQMANSSKSVRSSQVVDKFFEETCQPSEVAAEIKEKLDALFKHACFDIDEIKVCEHDDKTILVEFTGKDAALLIGKEGYRYKALSYMLYNWINATYQLQLRLEIAEFLKNQEEMICKYLEGVYVNIDRDGRAQTKILDGVLVQIALRELRGSYPDKYVAIRSTRDGAKFIIVNSFNNNENK